MNIVIFKYLMTWSLSFAVKSAMPCKHYHIIVPENRKIVLRNVYTPVNLIP